MVNLLGVEKNTTSKNNLQATCNHLFLFYFYLLLPNKNRQITKQFNEVKVSDLQLQ